MSFVAITVFQSIDSSLSIISFLFVIGLIGLFVLTSRTYRLLKTTREVGAIVKKTDENLSALRQQIETLNKNIAAMRTMQEDLNKAAQWFVDRENAKSFSQSSTN